MSANKTNAVRILEQKKIPYQLFPYDTEDGHNDGISVAEKTGANPEHVFKSLVAQGASRQYYVFVVPVLDELQLKKAALACGEKTVEMIPMKELLPLTGYIKGGFSPVGLQMGLSPTDLQKVTDARWAELC